MVPFPAENRTVTVYLSECDTEYLYPAQSGQLPAKLRSFRRAEYPPPTVALLQAFICFQSPIFIAFKLVCH